MSLSRELCVGDVSIFKRETELNVYLYVSCCTYVSMRETDRGLCYTHLVCLFVCKSKYNKIDVKR